MAVGVRNNRLAIPKVQQNPKPPKLANRIAAPKSISASAFNGAPPAGQGRLYTKGGPGMIVNNSLSGASAATTTAQPTNTAPGSTSAVSAVPYAAPESGLNSNFGAGPFKTPAWNPAVAGEKDPRDATYWANLSKLQFTDTQEYNKSLAEEGNENENYNYALQQAIQNRQHQERNLGLESIKGNLSASGWLNRTQADQTNQYTGERTHALKVHESDLQAFQAARSALEEGYGIDAAAELAEAVGRRGKWEREVAEQEAAERGSEEGEGSGAPSSGSTGPFVSNPGPQKASAFTHVALSNNQSASGSGQNAKAFANLLKKGKR